MCHWPRLRWSSSFALEFSKKNNVIGYDINPRRIKELKQGIDTTQEVDPQSSKSFQEIELTCDEKSLSRADIFIITVPTPIDDSNSPDLTHLKNASLMVGKYIKKGSYVIYESTTYPGCTEEECIPIIEEISKLKLSKDFYCGYSPERINPGDKVNTITKIKKITSGCCELSSLFIDNLYSSIISAGTYLAPSIKVAEAAKVIENTQRDLNIAFINELSIIFHKMDIDTMDVLKAAETKWNFLPFRPGMVGGHCMGVDPYYLTHKAENLGYTPQVILAGRRINDNMAKKTAQDIAKLLTSSNKNLSSSRALLLGTTFKENCPDIRNSKVFDLVNELAEWKINLDIVDPWANSQEVESKYGVKLLEIDLLNMPNDYDVLIVAVGHDEFRNLNVEDIKALLTNDSPIIADIKAIYDKDELIKNDFIVFRL